MLQNRVDPWGNIIRTSARGAWMGNRGVIHDEHREIVRPYRLKAWLTCVLEFKGRKREVMALDRYTELFFLDEATAFSAGHRPCFECRRKDFERFKSYWIEGNAQYGFDRKVSIAKIDNVLHAERTKRPRGAYEANRSIAIPDRETVRPAELPDGVFVEDAEMAFLIFGGIGYPWTPYGYGEAVDAAALEAPNLLTPVSMVNAFRAGYVPQVAALPGRWKM